MKYNDLSFGQAEAVFNKLGGEQGVMDFLSGKTMVVKVPSGEKIPFNVWKTITLGTHKNADEFRKAFKKNGFKIGEWGNDILGKPAFIVASAKEEIQLVNVSVSDLGFPKGAKYGDICAKAKELDLGLCPNEVGPQLRLQYKDQPKGEYLRIAMKPITDSHGDPRIFRVAHDDDVLWLRGYNGHSDYFWIAQYRFVFQLLRK